MTRGSAPGTTCRLIGRYFYAHGLYPTGPLLGTGLAPAKPSVSKVVWDVRFTDTPVADGPLGYLSGNRGAAICTRPHRPKRHVSC